MKLLQFAYVFVYVSFRVFVLVCVCVCICVYACSAYFAFVCWPYAGRLKFREGVAWSLVRGRFDVCHVGQRGSIST